MTTLSTNRKLQPTWSGPYCVQERNLNSYKLVGLEGTPRPGGYSASCLRIFIPQEGTELAVTQKELEEELAREDAEVGCAKLTTMEGEYGLKESKGDSQEGDEEVAEHSGG